MDKYNITLVQPRDYPYSQSFYEAMELFYYALNQLGYDTKMSINYVSDKRINIIFGAHLLSLKSEIGKHIIIFQTEDLSIHHPWRNVMLDNIQFAKEVWDYSSENFPYYKHLNVVSKVVKFKYQQELDRIPFRLEKDINVLFYGVVSPRRRAILDSIADLKPVYPAVAWGNIRDNLIARSKAVICMGVHKFAPENELVFRYHYLYNNCVCVLHEKTPKEIRDTINSDLWKRLAGSAYTGFCNYPMAKYLDKEIL